MEYIYAAMLIHKAGKKVDESTVKKVLEGAGIKPDEARVKALVASLQGVNIDEAVNKAAMPVAVAAPVAAQAEGAKPKEDKKKAEEDEKKKEEEASAGLSALFG